MEARLFLLARTWPSRFGFDAASRAAEKRAAKRRSRRRKLHSNPSTGTPCAESHLSGKINYEKTHLVSPSHCGLRAVFLHHCAGETRDRYHNDHNDRIQDEAAADTAAPTDGRQMRNKGSYRANAARARRRVAAAGLPRQAVRPGK